MNYAERIVLTDLTNAGYDVIKIEKKGFPDLKVYDPKTIKGFYVVKRTPHGKINEVSYTKHQQTHFELLTKENVDIYIAIPHKGRITYYNYTDATIIKTSTYGTAKENKEKKLVCFKCQYIWNPKTESMPKECPKCKNRNWMKQEEKTL